MASRPNIEVPTSLLQKMDDGMPKITITKSIGFTVNLQGYESARLDVSVTVEGLLSNKEEITKYVESEVENQMRTQISDLVNQHDPNKTLLGYRK